MGEWTEYEKGEPVRKVEIPDPTAQVYEGEDVLTVRIKPDSKVSFAEFPHPLVAIDYDENREIIGVEFVGPVAKTVIEAVRKHEQK